MSCWRIESFSLLAVHVAALAVPRLKRADTSVPRCTWFRKSIEAIEFMRFAAGINYEVTLECNLFASLLAYYRV